MPEGHTIHRLAKDHNAHLAKRVVQASAAQDRFKLGAARIDGQMLKRAEAWGKHLFHKYDNGEVLHVHLGLIGSWLPRPIETAAPPTTRLRLANGEVAWDLNGPMRCRLITPEEKAQVTRALGPDPLRRDADADRAWAKLHASTKPVGLLMMDQAVIAGIGNVYRSEILNIVGVDPRRPGQQLARSEFDAIWTETVRQLRLGVRRNKIITMDPAEIGRPLATLVKGEGRYVYKQTHCGRCHRELDIYDLAGRTTWSCPTCQPR